MANAGLELDFFGMEKQNTNTSSSARPQKFLNRRKSFRDIQGVISKLNPEVLKSVIGSGFPVDPSSNAAKSYIGEPESTSDTSPLTIFYNGTVSVFDVPMDKADNIFKLAERGFSKTAVTSTVTRWSNQPELPVPIDGGQSRRKSLQRFLAKRQERVTLPSPYICPNKDNLSQF